MPTVFLRLVRFVSLYLRKCAVLERCFSCSVKCHKTHKAYKCIPVLDVEQSNATLATKDNALYEFQTQDTVPLDRLALLGMLYWWRMAFFIFFDLFLERDEELKRIVSNKHLRTLLKAVDTAENVEDFMQKVMLEPLFVEFADVCLRIVESEYK